MKNITLIISLLAGWISSLGFCLVLWFENRSLSDKFIAESAQKHEIKAIVEASKNQKYSLGKEWEIFGLEDVEFFRTQGKVDGKIEAILMMSRNNAEIDESMATRIIEIAENASAKEIGNDPQFLSLLCQAAYHKGISTGETNALDSIEKEYEKGYHAAIEDFTCPETGSVKVPSQKEKIDMKKP